MNSTTCEMVRLRATPIISNWSAYAESLEEFSYGSYTQFFGANTTTNLVMHDPIKTWV